ncbi:hypothetical protein [Spongiimicrobium sp. 3-5]|uniref:hypothetical protein n=1 Tax=Spongiimicrobium sp. 3-5 TaxID=3332596 RepID=UPI00397EC666
MKSILTVVIFALFFLNLSGQQQPFEQIDFSKGDYYLLGVKWTGEETDLVKSIGNWYVDEIDVLNKIKSEWVFDTPGKQYACGYHYKIQLCRNHEIIKKFYVNLYCNEMLMEGEYFYFDTEKLTSIQPNLKKPIHKAESFNSLKAARDYHKSILGDSTLIWASSPKWLKFEGTFGFTYTDPNGDFDFSDDAEEILSELTEEIKTKYPREVFTLDNVGRSNDELYVKVHCNKSLADAFDIYSRRNTWETLPLHLNSYWVR